MSEARPPWLKIGLLSFGGPAAQIALLHEEVVTKRNWVSEEEFLHALDLCMLLPGPEAQQLATWMGWRTGGLGGAIAAGGLFVLPGFLVLLTLSSIYALWGSVGPVAAVFDLLTAAVVGLVAHAMIRIGRKAIRSVLLGFVALAALALLSAGVPFPLILLLAAAVGAMGVRNPPRAATEDRLAVAISASRLLLGYLLLAMLPLLPLAALGAPVLLDEARFFTKNAFLTFGGAYAILPYIAHEGVAFGWITPEAMLAGLGLAETTPGPLILVVTFLGFQGGWNHPGALPPLAAGLLGGTVATYYTFLPSFLLILLAAPYLERIRASRIAAPALAGITAAVAGVLVHFSLYLAARILIPGGAPDPVAIVAALLTFALVARARGV